MLEFAQGTCEVMQYRYVARLLTANGSVGHHDGAGAVTARVPRYRTESKCLVTLVCLRDHRYAFVSPRSDDPQAVGCNCQSVTAMKQSLAGPGPALISGEKEEVLNQRCIRPRYCTR